MTLCYFVSDLHGDTTRYRKLFQTIERTPPAALFLGGDFCPSSLGATEANSLDYADFIADFLMPALDTLAAKLGRSYPQIYVIMGNDDFRRHEPEIEAAASSGRWTYIHNRRVWFDSYQVYGYNYVPPTPFMHKDWERYDVSRYLDPGDVSPEAGWRSTTVSDHEKRYSTIARDLTHLISDENLEKTIVLFHAPPYNTNLDRCNNDGRMVDHAPLDLHVGSIAVRRFIQTRQPLLTLHGHIHESCRLTGCWKDTIGKTMMFSAAHDGPELALVRFDLDDLASADRILI